MWEVVYPTSRAVELGEEDEEEEKCLFQSHSSTPVLRMSNEMQSDNKINTSCELLVFAFGRIPTTFIEAHFINSESQIVGLVTGGSSKEECANSLRQTAIADRTCFIYSAISSEASDAEILFCQCKVDIPPESCHNWANKVISCIKAKEVIILSSLPASVCSLNCDVNVDSDHMFALKTDSWKLDIKCPFLEPPNIISNLPAAVLTHCQIFNIPAMMYVAVTATDSVIDSTVVEIFNILLDKDPLKDVPKCSKSETTKFLKSVKITYPHLDSNIYI